MAANQHSTSMNRRMFLKRAGALTFLLGGAGLLEACGGAATPVAAPPATATTGQAPLATATTSQRGGTLTIARAGDFTTFNPFNLSIVNRPNQNQLFNRLLRFSPDRVPQAELAESWEFSDDNLKLTIKLRSGVQFSNGQELTADDVVFNIERLKDEEAGHGLFPVAAAIEQVTALDSSTVEVQLSRPLLALLDLLDFMFIVNKDNIPSLDNNPIGTGPFVFSEWIPGDSAEFIRNENYFLPGLPYLDKIVVRTFPSPQAMITNLEAGDIDLIEGVPYPDVESVSQMDGITVERSYSFGDFYHLTLNTSRAPFDNKKVRQALAYAINREQIAQTVLYGLGEPITSPFYPTTSPLYDPELSKNAYTYDLEKAKQLLTEAGFGDGFETTIATVSSFPEWANMMQIFQQDLAKIGITAEIQDRGSTEGYPTYLEGNFDMAVWSSAGVVRDPAVFFVIASTFRANANRAKFESEAYTKLLADGEAAADPDERINIYRQAQRMLIDEAFAIPIASSPTIWAYRDTVRDFMWDINSYMRLEQVWLA